jgi:trimeric autotransporter adhesin
MPRQFATLALALILASPAIAQDTNSTSGSAANANSGSVSGAQSNGNEQAQGQTQNNAGIGSSASHSESNSGAVSGSDSHSGAVSDQSQGQSLSNGNTNSLGQTASNQQGVSVSNTFNSTNWKRSYVSTNTAVPLAASSSFSSDYCGGTVSGGASAAPIGISIGGAAPSFDKSCQSLRRAEKFGMAAANYQNMQQPEMAMKLMSLMVWSICTADSAGPKADRATAEACAQLLNMGSASPAPGVYAVPPAPPLPVPPAVTPLEAQKPNVEPATPTTQPDYQELPPKTPRGEIKRSDGHDTAFAATLPRTP